MITSTISLTEFIWTILGLFGLLVTAENLHAARATRKTLADVNDNGDLETLANFHVMQEFLRTCKMLVIIGMGAISMSVPPVNPHVPISPVQIVVTVGVFFIVLLVIAQSVLARQVRVKLEGKDDVS